jgi:hypothetical protein
MKVPTSMADVHNNSWIPFADKCIERAARIPIIDTVARLQEAEQSTPVTARYAPLFDDLLRAATQGASVIITGASSAEIVPMPESRHG